MEKYFVMGEAWSGWVSIIHPSGNLRGVYQCCIWYEGDENGDFHEFPCAEHLEQFLDELPEGEDTIGYHAFNQFSISSSSDSEGDFGYLG